MRGIATSGFWDFFVWWGEELKGLFTGGDARDHDGLQIKDSIRLVVGDGHVAVVRLQPDGTETEMLRETGAPDHLRTSGQLIKALEHADQVELVADRNIAQIKTFRLPDTVPPAEVDMFRQQIRHLAPQGDAGKPQRLSMAVRLEPLADGGSALDFGFLSTRTLKPWADRIEQDGAHYKFGGILDDKGLIPAVSPSLRGQAHQNLLPARLEDVPPVPVEPRPRYGPLLVLGLLLSAALLAFGVHQMRERQITTVQTNAEQAVSTAEDADALEAALQAARERRMLLVARSRMLPPGAVLEMLAIRLPNPSAVTRIVIDGERVRVEGETRSPGLEGAFADEPVVTNISATLGDEKTPAGATPFVLQIDLAAPAEGKP